jgi:drug/metabolite transporter (DMT)-like permease
MTPQQRAAPVLLALGFTWGCSFLFIKVLLDNTGPLEIALGRTALGAIAVAVYMAVSRRPWRASPRLVARVSVMAVLNNVLPFVMIAWAEQHITSGTASILNATVPIFTALVAVALLEEERLTPARLGGLALAFCGVGVLTGSDIVHVTDSNVLAEFAVVGAAAFYGIGTVYTRSTLHGEDSVSVSLIQLTLAALFLLPITLAVTSGTPDYSMSLKAYGSIAALGLVGTGLAYIAFFWLIENIGSVRAVTVTYIVPFVGVVVGWLALNESIGLNTVAGGLLIVAGVASVLRGQAPVRPPLAVPAGAPRTAVDGEPRTREPRTSDAKQGSQ